MIKSAHSTGAHSIRSTVFLQRVGTMRLSRSLPIRSCSNTSSTAASRWTISAFSARNDCNVASRRAVLMGSVRPVYADERLVSIASPRPVSPGRPVRRADTRAVRAESRTVRMRSSLGGRSRVVERDDALGRRPWYDSFESRCCGAEGACQATGASLDALARASRTCCSATSSLGTFVDG